MNLKVGRASVLLCGPLLSLSTRITLTSDCQATELCALLPAALMDL